MTTQVDMEAVVEAILFVSNDPVSRDKLLAVFGDGEREAASQALEQVIERYRQRPESGLMLDEVAGGLRLVSRPDLHGYLRRFFEVSGTNKLSMAALETLAIVAYRQPVTGPEITELRGVGSQGVLKTLLERRLVRVAGRKEVVGKPFLYATTREFLMHFGLRSLRELPPLEQFEELFVGDPDAVAGKTELDQEEVADQEAAAIEEEQEDERLRDEAAQDEAQQKENEAAELPVDAEAPDATADDAAQDEDHETSRQKDAEDDAEDAVEEDAEDAVEEKARPEVPSGEEPEARGESEQDEISAPPQASEDEGRL